MKNSRILLRTIFILAYCVSVHAAPQILLTEDKRTVLNLMETDLVKKKNLLDCELRLEGIHPKYKLMYSLGEIVVPEKAVKMAAGQHRLIAVQASVSGIPVTKLWVRYNAEYRLEISCRKGSTKCVAPVAIEMLLKESEKRAFKKLLSDYPREQIQSGTYDPEGEANPGAIVVADRQNLISPAMEGHAGAKDKHETILYYACGTSIIYFE